MPVNCRLADVSNSNLHLCRKILLPKIEDSRGNLTFINGSVHIPFSIGRTYFVYDVPAGSERGGHGHKKLHEFVIAVSGSFDVVLDDGRDQQTFNLNRPYEGLYVAPMVWRDLSNFSSGAVCLVMASEVFDEADYIRNYDQYVDEALA